MATSANKGGKTRTVRAVVLGDSSVGKTCLVMKHATDEFPEKDVPSSFAHTPSEKVDIHGLSVEFSVADIAGQDGLNMLKNKEFTDVDVFIVCLSTVDHTSFENVKTKWIPELKEHYPDIPVVLTGTKADLQEDQDTLDKLQENDLEPIDFFMGDELSDELDRTIYVECSALHGTGVNDVFDHALQVGLDYQLGDGNYDDDDFVDDIQDDAVKCLLVGDSGVGKTCLIIAYVTNVFPEAYVPTLFDHYTATVNVGGELLNYKLCDTAGDDDFDQLRPLDYPTTDVFMICFSIAEPASFDHVKSKWVPELKKHRPDVPVVLVGTKQDLQDDEETVENLAKKKTTPISFTQGSELAQDIGAKKYVECSSLRKQGLKHAFDAALQAALDNMACSEEVEEEKKEKEEEKEKEEKETII